MAWDGSRPVPWRRLVLPVAIYIAVANVLFLVIGGKRYGGSVLVATIVGGGAYVAIMVALVKLGWTPKALQRRPRSAASTSSPAAGGASTSSRSAGPAPTGASRAKPAPTKRTNATNPKAKR